GEFHFVQRIHELVDTRDGAVEMKLFDIFGDLPDNAVRGFAQRLGGLRKLQWGRRADWRNRPRILGDIAMQPLHEAPGAGCARIRSEEHTSELQSRENLVCRLLLEKKKKQTKPTN